MPYHASLKRGGSASALEDARSSPNHIDGATTTDLVILGDSHEHHRQIKVPSGDLLIFTGDFTNFSKSFAAIDDFNDWLRERPHRFKLVIPGNHEFFLEANPVRRSLIYNATVLIDEATTIGGLKIYGSPVTPLYCGAFGKCSPADRVKHWSNLPNGVDILITHGPPHGILDLSPGEKHHMGDPELRARLNDLASLRLHCFGHVHGGYGSRVEQGCTFVHAALMGKDDA